MEPLLQGESPLDRGDVVADKLLGVVVEQVDTAVDHSDEHVAVGELDKREYLVARQRILVVGVVCIIDNGVVFHVQHTDTVVLRTDPDIAETVFVYRIDFIGADVAVGRQVVDGTMVVALETDGTGPAGREPDVAPAVLDDAADVAEIGNVGVGKTDGREAVGRPVEQLQAAGGSHPQIAFGIVVDRQHRIVVERGLIVEYVVVGLELQPVETVQTVVGTNPNKTGPILIDTVYMTVGESLLQTIKLISIRQEWKNREPEQIK